MSTTIRALILAAGRGSRLGTLTSTQPKCLVKIHNKPLLHWQIDALLEAGIRDIAVVRGYQAEAIRVDAIYFENPRWRETNMVASVLAAESWLRDETTIVSYSDIIYSSDSVSRLTKETGDIVLTYDPNWLRLWQQRFTNPLDDAESFQIGSQNRILDIGRRVTDLGLIEGQFMGLLKFTPRGWQLLGSVIETISPGERESLDMTSLLRLAIAQGIAVYGVPIIDPWFEVDTPFDVELYEKMAAPLLGPHCRVRPGAQNADL